MCLLSRRAERREALRPARGGVIYRLARACIPAPRGLAPEDLA